MIHIFKLLIFVLSASSFFATPNARSANNIFEVKICSSINIDVVKPVKEIHFNGFNLPASSYYIDKDVAQQEVILQAMEKMETNKNFHLFSHGRSGEL